jgi:uncharacterized repeat protein (TIGR01451 family)
VLSGGYFLTGNIAFTLTGPGGFLFTQTVTVNGNGTYTASAPLPTTGSVAGTYTWTARYSGDANNNAANDQGGVEEQVTVPQASPSLVSTASPAVTLGTTTRTLSDSADLEGGVTPTGDIVFTLTGPGGFKYTQTVIVNGNGIYTASTTLPTTGLVAGTYTWTDTYEGDANNTVAIDQGGITEQTVVRAAHPTITTTPNPTTTVQGGTLQDTAMLSGGYHPTGTITFRLYATGVDPSVGPPAYTETVAVSGNGLYHTTVGFAANASGSWHWVASFNGDSNNNSVLSGPLDEPVTVVPPVIPPPPSADLSVVKQFSAAQVTFGFNVESTLVVHNNGPDDATNVVLNDPLPAGLFFVSASPSQGTYDPATGVWAVGTLPVGVTAVLQIVAQVVTVGPIVNNAAVGGDQGDPDLSNNRSQAVVEGMEPAGTITKRAFLASLETQMFNPTDALLVSDLYRDVLGREADPQALAANVLFLANGGSRLQVSLAIENSHEHHADEVNDIYLKLLHRTADPAGLNGFTALLDAGDTLQHVEALVASSLEYFQSRGGGTTAGFLAALYEDALGRPIDATGQADWTSLLAQGATPEEVALGILSSAEADKVLVESLYTQFLHRAPDPGGEANWISDLQQGMSVETLAAAILSSNEYYARP